MKSLDFLNEGIGEDAHEMHLDHEVQMARQELYHAAEDAIALHKLLRHVSEQQGLEGWVSSKITLAADYLNTIREHLEYQMMSGGPAENITTVVGNAMPVAEGVAFGFGDRFYEQLALQTFEVNPNLNDENKILNLGYKIAKGYMGSRVNAVFRDEDFPSDFVSAYGYLKKQGVAEDKQPYTSDEMVNILSGAKTQAQVDADRKAASQQQTTTTQQPAPQPPQQPAKKVNERKSKSLAEGQIKKAMEADAERMDLDEFLSKWAHRSEDEQWITEFWNAINGEGNQLSEMSAGSVATVVNPAGKNKAKVGSLFGGTYKQSKPKAK